MSSWRYQLLVPLFAFILWYNRVMRTEHTITQCRFRFSEAVPSKPTQDAPTAFLCLVPTIGSLKKRPFFLLHLYYCSKYLPLLWNGGTSLQQNNEHRLRCSLFLSVAPCLVARLDRLRPAEAVCSASMCVYWVCESTAALSPVQVAAGATVTATVKLKRCLAQVHKPSAELVVERQIASSSSAFVI